LHAGAGDVENIAIAAMGKKTKFRGHVLICGMSDSIGYLLRSIAATFTPTEGSAGSPETAKKPARGLLTDGEADFVEGDQVKLTNVVFLFALASLNVPLQFDIRPEDIVVLAAAKAADAAANAMYPGSSRLLSKVTFIAGSPSEAGALALPAVHFK
jgi:hypothetical protein